MRPVGHTQIFPTQPLYSRRLVHELQKDLVQLCVFLDGRGLDQLHQARKDALGLHHGEGDIVTATAAIMEEEGGDNMKGRVVVLLGLG